MPPAGSASPPPPTGPGTVRARWVRRSPEQREPVRREPGRREPGQRESRRRPGSPAGQRPPARSGWDPTPPGPRREPPRQETPPQGAPCLALRRAQSRSVPQRRQAPGFGRGGGFAAAPARGRPRLQRSARTAGRHSADLEATLDAVQARGIPALAGGAREQHARADELELETRGGGAGHLRQAGVDDVGGPRQRAGAKRRSLLAHPLDLVLGVAAQHRGGAVGHRRDDDEVTQPLEEVLDEAARVEPGLDDPVDLGEHPSPVTGGEGVDDRVEQLAVGEAEQRRRALVGQAVVSRAGDELVEHRERVTHGSPPARTTNESTPGATVTPSLAQSCSM